jgi:hypothetical protein
MKSLPLPPEGWRFLLGLENPSQDGVQFANFYQKMNYFTNQNFSYFQLIKNGGLE